MLRSTNFWETEFKIPLLKMDHGFLKEEGIEKIIKRASNWKDIAGLKSEDIKTIEYGTEKPEEIFVLDAERTFSTADNKARLVKILTYLKKQFGDYQQGFSFVTSFMMLTLPEEENIAIMLKINSMLPGYWKHEAIDYGISALTFNNILQKIFPEISVHLQKNLIQPETFCSKWFLGLFVHLLPFRYLFQFMEKFLAGGVVYLYKFGLGLMEVLKSRILATDNVNVIYALLRLDSPEIKDEDFQKITDAAEKYDLSKFDLEAIGKQVYELHLKSRIEKAHQVHAKVEEIPDCQWCYDDFPELYCIQCKQLVCQACIDDYADDHDHDDSHKTVDMDEFETNKSKYPLKNTEKEEEEGSEDELEQLDMKKLEIK
ncbi:RabGAP/TBC domain-containing protein [Tieghemostelium lacteum]|uniref:RabGAP/TBC domain-containing protein n=1 Tax=Tieghemostelium lacteum TaxID=361077 RepID=A0A152A3B8_TIELA|nr:RabGAP/TBC domain-containing protein [Tieghemostelium lacteum]|eukprot:KYR00738.1 RabGAP/TBC domain-containing protein [Tieghemostelium lacteum]